MIIKNIKKNRGFVILFAVTLAALLLSIALGVANIALKEIKFGTSARDTNDAFFAADSGIECALFYDNGVTSSFGGSGGSSIQCSGSSIAISGSSPSWNFVVLGLGSSGQSCANVSIDKSSGTTIFSKGYNIGDGPACSPTNPNRVERELKTTYGGSALPPPPSGSYAHHRVINIIGSVPSTQTNFPVLINIPSSDPVATSLKNSVINANGYDIMFTQNADGTGVLNSEIESYNSSSGALVAWVKMPSLNNGTSFYMFYGKSGVSSPSNPSSAVWDNNYKGVWHLNGSTLSVVDSTGQNSCSNNGATATTGKADGGANFVRTSSQYIDCGTGLDISGAITLSVWLKATSFPADYVSPLNRPSTLNAQWGILFPNSGGTWIPHTSYSDASAMSGNVITTGSWFNLAYSRPTPVGGYSTLVAYQNGSSVGTIHSYVASADTTNHASMGRDPVNSRYFDGSLDEVRISDIARSADWIKTEYNNQNSPSTFMSVGAEQ